MCRGLAASSGLDVTESCESSRWCQLCSAHLRGVGLTGEAGAVLQHLDSHHIKGCHVFHCLTNRALQLRLGAAGLQKDVLLVFGLESINKIFREKKKK